MAEHFFSLRSAQWIADSVVTVRRRSPGAFFEIELATDRGEKEIVPPLFVRECAPAENRPSGGEQLHCVSQNGEMITILMPLPAERKEQKAEIIIGA